MNEQARLAVFGWLEEQVLIHGDVLLRALLEKGFYLGSQRITLVGPQGIWKPKVFKQTPLSVTAVSNSPYDNFLRKTVFSLTVTGVPTQTTEIMLVYVKR